MGALSIVNCLRNLYKGRVVLDLSIRRVVFDCEVSIYIEIECGPGKVAVRDNRKLTKQKRAHATAEK